jgi:hypothetical protein
VHERSNGLTLPAPVGSRARSEVVRGACTAPGDTINGRVVAARPVRTTLGPTSEMQRSTT